MADENQFRGNLEDLSAADRALLNPNQEGNGEQPTRGENTERTDAPPPAPETLPLNGPETGGRNFLDATREQLAKLGDDLKSWTEGATDSVGMMYTRAKAGITESSKEIHTGLIKFDALGKFHKLMEAIGDNLPNSEAELAMVVLALGLPAVLNYINKLQVAA